MRHKGDHYYYSKYANKGYSNAYFSNALKMKLKFLHSVCDELYLYASLVFFLIRKHLMAQSILTTSSELMDVDDATLWSSTVEKHFIDIMVEEVNTGNRRGGVFTQKIWTKIHKDLKIKNNQNYSIKQVKH